MIPIDGIDIDYSCMASSTLPSDFDLNLLRALDRLLATKSVSAAARSLSVGQPAMSKTLQRLREVLADPLLVRVGHKMMPTPRAVALMQPVADALLAAGRVLAPPEVFDPATASGKIVIAMPEHAHISVAVPLVEQLRALAPAIDLRIRNVTYATRLEVARAEVTLAIIPDVRELPHFPKADLSSFVLRPLYREAYAVVSAKRRNKKKWTLASYVRAQHVLVTSIGESDTGLVDKILERQGLTRRIAVTVPGFLQAARLVETTDLVATLPERLARAAGYELHVQPPPCSIPTLSMLMAWSPRDTLDPRHRWLRELLTKCAAGFSSSSR